MYWSQRVSMLLKCAEWCLSLFLVVISQVQGKQITCLCTTMQCQEQQTTRCNTTSMCYSQYLDRKDGSNPLVRGCITSKTPLLCENRRPAILDANWPVLMCCNSNMCNQDVMPTPPTRGRTSPEANSTSDDAGSSSNKDSTTKEGEIKEEIDANATSNTPTTSKMHLISPVYITVLVVGVCSLVLIGVIAMFVLRRQTRLYEADYSSIERNGYLKGHRQVVARDDPELQLPLPSAKTTSSYSNNKLNSRT